MKQHFWYVWRTLGGGGGGGGFSQRSVFHSQWELRWLKILSGRKFIGEAKQLRQEKHAMPKPRSECCLGWRRPKSFGPEDRRLAVTLNELAALYHASLRFSEAEALYRRALGIWEKRFPSVWSKPRP